MKIIIGSIIMSALGLTLAFSAVPQPRQSEVKPALLVIDIQNEFLPSMAEQDRKSGLEMINTYIALFRMYDLPIIRIYHTDPQEGPKPDTEAFEFPKTMMIRESDPKIIKNFGNAFKKTDLEKLLKEKGVNTLFLCGLSATACVLATYHGGLDLDFNTFMLKGALISGNADSTKAVHEICRTISPSALRLLLYACRH